MAAWYAQQRNRLAQPGYAFRQSLTATAAAIGGPPRMIEARIAGAAEALRVLHDSGDIEWSDLSPRAACEMTFVDDHDDA